MTSSGHAQLNPAYSNAGYGTDPIGATNSNNSTAAFTSTLMQQMLAGSANPNTQQQSHGQMMGQQQQQRTRRDEVSRPINKLTSELIKTYKNINEVGI